MDEMFKKLTQLIKEYENIVIITHKNPDFDGLSSSIALGQIINKFKKNAYVLINENDMNIPLLKAYKRLNKDSLNVKVITNDELNKKIDEKWLIVVIDVHKEIMLENNEILKKNQNIVIIDHHIKSVGYIKNYILSYINSNMSSVVEIMVHYLKYLNVELDPFIATMMLAGLEIDTNSFNLKTTDSTYDTASILMKMGADNIIKQEFMQENKDDYIKRQKLVASSFMATDNMAMCVADNEIYDKKDLASISEELLQFENVDASFTIGKISDNEIGISARSIGKIDVEKMMALLGGGGHITEAAAQIKDKSLKEVKKLVIDIIGGKA